MARSLDAALTLLVAIIWWAAFRANDALFSSLNYSPQACWIFLPAALRIIAVLLFENVGVIGLALGAWLTLPHAFDNPLHNAALASSSGLAPLIAVSFCRHIFSLPDSLSGLRPYHIVVLSFAGAVANSLVLDSYLAIAGRLRFDIHQAMTILVGDITGSAITLMALSTALNLLVQARRSSERARNRAG